MRQVSHTEYCNPISLRDRREYYRRIKSREKCLWRGSRSSREMKKRPQTKTQEDVYLQQSFLRGWTRSADSLSSYHRSLKYQLTQYRSLHSIEQRQKIQEQQLVQVLTLIGQKNLVCHKNISQTTNIRQYIYEGIPNNQISFSQIMAFQRELESNRASQRRETARYIAEVADLTRQRRYNPRKADKKLSKVSKNIYQNCATSRKNVRKVKLTKTAVQSVSRT